MLHKVIAIPLETSITQFLAASDPPSHLTWERCTDSTSGYSPLRSSAGPFTLQLSSKDPDDMVLHI